MMLFLFVGCCFFVVVFYLVGSGDFSNSFFVVVLLLLIGCLVCSFVRSIWGFGVVFVCLFVLLLLFSTSFSVIHLV